MTKATTNQNTSPNEWTKPELTILSITDDTLGGLNPGDDGGGLNTAS